MSDLRRLRAQWLLFRMREERNKQLGCLPCTAAVVGSTDLPIADREREWDGDAAMDRVFEFYTDEDGSVDTDGVGRAFLWRDPDADPATQAAYKLGFADVIDDRLQIVPRGVAATAGGRGVSAVEGVSEDDKSRIESKICTLYGKLQDEFDDWPDCPLEPVAAAAESDIPIRGMAALYDVWSSDGGDIRRRIEGGALRWNLEEEGIPIVVDHDGGTRQVIGRIDTAENTEAGMEVTGRLFDDGSEEFARIVNLISENALGWSVMLSEEQGNIRMLEPEDIEESEDGSIEVQMSVIQEFTVTSARVRHLALVDVPAFPGARPELGVEPVAAAAAVSFPAAHFTKWESREAVALRVEPDGRIWGHAAGDGCYRNGSNQCQKYTPDPDPQMKNFHTGTVTLDSGETIRAGSLTCASLHATPNMNHNQQRQHHENTSTVWARVIAWNDNRGRLCIAGSTIPGLSENILSQVQGQPLSVELWPVPGVSGLTLVGAHTVVTPAWPVAASV